jgi:hypothetical protein
MKKLFLLLFAVFAAGYVFSAPLESLLDAPVAQTLQSNDASIREIQLRNPTLKLVPKNADLQGFVSGIKTSLDPSVAVETLYLYRKPGSSGDASWADLRAALFNQTLSLSTLTGIEYYSATRKTMRTFYVFSHVIDSPETKRQINDPVFEQPPESLTIYARQKDLSFGDNIYRYNFVSTQEAFFFSQENLTALNYGIIPAVGKNRLRSVFAVIDSGDFLLIYAVSMAKAASVPGMGDRIGNSFENRAEAVLKWFIDRADRVFLGN